MEKLEEITIFIKENLTTWISDYPWLVVILLILPTSLLMIHSISFWRSKNSFLKGFQEGYLKAWDVMIPLLSDTMIMSHKTIRSSASEEMRKRMEHLIGNNKNKNKHFSWFNKHK